MKISILVTTPARAFCGLPLATHEKFDDHVVIRRHHRLNSFLPNKTRLSNVGGRPRNPKPSHDHSHDHQIPKLGNHIGWLGKLPFVGEVKRLVMKPSAAETRRRKPLPPTFGGHGHLWPSSRRGGNGAVFLLFFVGTKDPSADWQKRVSR